MVRNAKKIMFLQKIDLSPRRREKSEESISIDRIVYMKNIRKIDEKMKIYIEKEVKNIDDLLELGRMYVPGYDYNIDLYRLNKIYEPLEKLNKAVGLNRIKEDIIKHIIYFLQDFNGEKDDMLHTVIQGRPGVGKTMVGQIIGEIYWKLGIIKHEGNDYKFRIIKRSDLIGQYLGTTAKKTQEVIDSCIGGVMFIDEAYALGNPGKQDIYSKECIDTINQNLTEKKDKFLCIIAGYEDDLEKCFFRYNEGLRRRFPFVYTIDKYTSSELTKIFLHMVKAKDWEVEVSEEELFDIFEKNYETMENQAGDIETLVFNCKLEHSQRVFCLEEIDRNKINNTDIENGLKSLKKSRQSDKAAEQKKIEENIMKTLYC